MKHKIASITSMLAMTSFFAACGDIDGVPAEQAQMAESRSGSMHVLAAPNARQLSDVAFIKYTITSCAGAAVEFSNTAIVPLDNEMTLPGGIGHFENSPLDKNSSHLFADLFQVLDPGCYNVVGEPLNADQNPSEHCSMAESKELTVLEGATTEALMIVQCQSPDPGAADVVTVVNHEPRITNIVFKKRLEDGSLVNGKKFACGFENHFCIDARDADHDPLSFKVTATIEEDPNVCKVHELGGSDEGDAQSEQCFHIKCDVGGRVDLDVTVFDLLHNSAGDLITFEDYFDALGTPKTSRAHMSFMTYLGGKDDCEKPCEDCGTGTGTGGTGHCPDKPDGCPDCPPEN